MPCYIVRRSSSLILLSSSSRTDRVKEGGCIGVTVGRRGATATAVAATAAEVTSSHPAKRERVFSFLLYIAKKREGGGEEWTTTTTLPMSPVFALVERLCISFGVVATATASACTSEVLIALQTLAQEQTLRVLTRSRLALFYYYNLSKRGVLSALKYPPPHLPTTTTITPLQLLMRETHPLSFIKLVA